MHLELQLAKPFGLKMEKQSITRGESVADISVVPRTASPEECVRPPGTYA